jgi:hypothetical protein
MCYKYLKKLPGRGTKRVRGFPSPCRTSRCRSGVYNDYVTKTSSLGRVVCVRSGGNRDLLADAPDKARQFSCDRHADLVVLHAARGELPIAMVQAQLRPPGDSADGGGLLLLSLLQRRGDARGEAVIPGRLDQYPTRMAVAGLGDRSKPAFLPAGVCSEGTSPRYPINSRGRAKRRSSPSSAAKVVATS